MISVIIPVLNEAKALPATLAALSTQSGSFEVIVVDAGSSDATVNVAAKHVGAQVIQSPRGRATQMNAGARQAKGEWLIFLHADTLLPCNALAEILNLPAKISAGGFRHSFSGNSSLLRAISWINNKRCRSTGVFFGDQALFVRRALFKKMGGFPEQAVMEDLSFSRRLVDDYTRPVLLDSSVTTDARKFLKMGIFASLWRVAIILTYLELRRPIPMHSLRFFQNIR